MEGSKKCSHHFITISCGVFAFAVTEFTLDLDSLLWYLLWILIWYLLQSY